MSENVKVYTPDEVVIVVGPALIESGLADGEFVRLEQESDDTSDVAGVDGEVSVSRGNDKRATLTIILQATSDHNDTLSVLSNLVRNAPGMTGAIVPFALKDRNGRAKYTGENCWVQKPPDVSFDRQTTPREWTIRIAHCIRFDGGN